MNLDECSTIKQCFLWAEQEWPGFWEFANCKEVNKNDILALTKALDKNENLFNSFMEKLREVAMEDTSKDARRLLKNGANSFKSLRRYL